MTQFLNSSGTPVTVENSGYLLVYCPANVHFLVAVFNGGKVFLLAFVTFWVFPIVNIDREEFGQNSEGLCKRNAVILYNLC